MINRIAYIIFFTLLLSGCNTKSGLEESIIIYGAEKKQLFIKVLDEKNVDYRVHDDGQIFYPVEQKQVVIEAFEKVTGKKIPDYPPPQ